MKHLDLFSGIGGFALAADRVFGNVEHTFCEIDPFCQEVLKKHWPQAEIYGDIRTLTNTASSRRRPTEAVANENGKAQPEQDRELERGFERPFILTGGFPCQPFSQAGRRKGTADDRHLWPEMLRIIREFAPLWVVGENVGGFVTWNDGMVLRQVFSDLESEGYEVQAFIIPAISVNTPHRRDRIWIVAHSRFGGQEKRKKQTTGSKQLHQDAQNVLGVRRRRGSENSGQILERQTAEVQVKRPNRQSGNIAHSERTGHEGQEHKARQSARHSRRTQSPNWSANWLEVATRLCRVDDGLPRRLDRNPRLKALGNAIVPQVAEEIFKAIKLTP